MSDQTIVEGRSTIYTYQSPKNAAKRTCHMH